MSGVSSRAILRSQGQRSKSNFVRKCKKIVLAHIVAEKCIISRKTKTRMNAFFATRFVQYSSERFCQDVNLYLP